MSDPLGLEQPKVIWESLRCRHVAVGTDPDEKGRRIGKEKFRSFFRIVLDVSPRESRILHSFGTAVPAMRPGPADGRTQCSVELFEK